MAIEDLKEDRARALANAQEILSDVEEERGEDASLTEEERQQVDRWTERAAEKQKEIQAARDDQRRKERVEEMANARDERIAGPDADFETAEEERESYDYGEWKNAFTRYLQHGQSELSNEEIRTLRDRVPGYEARESDVIVGTSGQGGVLVPTEFQATLFQELKQFGGLQSAVDAAPGDPIDFPLDTADGRDLDVPLMDDTANLASHVNEGSTIGSVSNISLNDVTFSAQVYQSGPLAVSIEMMQDSAIDPEELVRMAISNRIGRRWAKDLIDSTATSSTAVEGLVTASSGAVSIANGSSNLGFGDLYDLRHSVDPAHRNRDGRWLFTDNTFKEISKITDSNGQFLLQPDLQAGTAEDLTLLGHPIHLDNSSTVIEFDAVASASTGKKVIWFGNFGRFGIRRILQTEVRTLTEKFALQRKIGFVGWVRVDSRVMQSTGLAAAQRPIRCLVENT